MYLLLNLYLTILIVGYGTSGTENNPSINFKNLYISGKELPSPDKLNQLASQMLTDSFDSRHKPVLDSIDNFNTPALENMKNTLMTKQREKIFDIQTENDRAIARNKLPNLKALTAETTKLENLENFSIDDYKRNVRKQIQTEKGLDTISIRLDGDQVFLAGNVKTRKLPLKLDDPELFNRVLNNPLMKDLKGKGIKFDYEDFGIQNQDAFAFQKTLESPLAKELGIGKNSEVFALQPVYNPIVEADMISQINSEKTALERRKSNKLTELEGQRKKSKADIQIEKDNVELKFKSVSVSDDYEWMISV